MKKVAISADEFIKYGCPCCCKFSVMFYQCVFGTRVAECKVTDKKFYIVADGGKTSSLTDDTGNIATVIEHPFGQM